MTISCLDNLLNSCTRKQNKIHCFRIKGEDLHVFDCCVRSNGLAWIWYLTHSVYNIAAGLSLLRRTLMMTTGAMRTLLFSPSPPISTSFWPSLLPEDIHIEKTCLPIVSSHIVLHVLLLIKKFDMFVEIFKKDVCH